MLSLATLSFALINPKIALEILQVAGIFLLTLAGMIGQVLLLALNLIFKVFSEAIAYVNASNKFLSYLLSLDIIGSFLFGLFFVLLFIAVPIAIFVSLYLTFAYVYYIFLEHKYRNRKAKNVSVLPYSPKKKIGYNNIKFVPKDKKDLN
jgi:hypothetical protein